jgi:hypothetical protein
MNAQTGHTDSFHSVVARFVEATNGKPRYDQFWSWLRAQEAAHDVFLAAWNSLPLPEATFFDILSLELERWKREHN